MTTQQGRGSAPRPLVPRLRRGLARRLDPQLVTRPAPGGPATREAEQVAALRRAVRRLRNGRASTDELAAAARLTETYLEANAGAKASPRMRAAVSAAFAGLWQPRSQPVREPEAAVTEVIRDQFHRLYYHVSPRTWKDTWYRGIRTYKCPTDMWVYQELIDNLRPGLVVETGTFRGGSALFIADRLEIAGSGEVVSIDIDVQPDRPEHPRLTYLTGSSVAPDILEEVRRRVPENQPVLVILDSDHSRAHVAAELRAYAPLVPVGSYLIVEDTNVNGHPAAPDHGPGPWEAVRDFLAEDPGFEVDERCERYFLTQNPSGYLRRVRPEQGR